MATTEHTINDAIAAALRETRRVWKSSEIVKSENTGLLKDSSGRPDILVLEPNVSPVVIETEIKPAVSVESEAVARLGKHLRTAGRTILSAIAIRLPQRLKNKSGAKLKNDVDGMDDFEMALYTGSDTSTASRWPGTGWLTGDIAQLSLLVQSASIPPDVIDQAANELVSGISDSAGLLEEIAQVHSGAMAKICEELKQDDCEQTRRMATTILANAFVFHETLAGGPRELASVKSLDELRSTDGRLTKSEILFEWRKILNVNYWPIFDIARRILEVLPSANCSALIGRLATTADKLLANHLMRSHDLTGAVFQRLIADRKFLAAFYTAPASAALLVGLAIVPDKLPNGGAWANRQEVQAMRIADFACGTGTLLSTAYQRIGQLHELAGGNAEALHPAFMANSLIGCDVLPAAAHLTASMLSGAHPTVKYEGSRIMTVAYGIQPFGAVALGSLNLLDEQSELSILAITAKASEARGERRTDTATSIPHGSCDVVIMNPPFTRATGHEAEKIGIANPMFAAFSSNEAEQREMAKALQPLLGDSCAHGNAGEASIFLVLADRKLKPGGVLAMVLPLSLMSGDAWTDARTMLAKRYSDLILVSISGEGGAELSFSADTDMGECLLIGRKSIGGSQRATFVILKSRPEYPLLGASTAQQIHSQRSNIQTLEQGPDGGTRLMFGADLIGHVVDAPLPSGEGSWNLARIADISLAQSAYQLIELNRIWLPGEPEGQSIAVPITSVSKIGKIGPYHADINGKTPKGGIRGPFDVERKSLASAPTYPVLWSHDAKEQCTMAFEGESEGIARKGKSAAERQLISDKIADLVQTMSNCHFNRDFRFNSQSTSMQFTRRKTIGGRAWISIKLNTEDEEKALVLWANTSFGILLHWYVSNKQQSGRGSIGVQPLSWFPVLDVTTLSSKQVKAAGEIFEQFSDRELKPIHEIDKDSTRRELDTAFAIRILKLPKRIVDTDGPLELLRSKLSREPSIRGHKR